MNHEKVEKNIGLMGVLIALVVSVGGLVEIVPLMYQAEAVQPSEGVLPYPALELAGRDIYVREGCHGCHSQMIRTLAFETQRYGKFSLAGESVYDHPFQWGSKRTGPDLARVGARYSDEWHRVHLRNPRDVVPESNMPGYPWLERSLVDGADIANHMRALKMLGTPYQEQAIAAAPAQLADKSEMDALVAYLQFLGHAGRPKPVVAPTAAAGSATPGGIKAAGMRPPGVEPAGESLAARRAAAQQSRSAGGAQ